MKTIWKFPLKVSDRTYLQLPKGAELLAFQTQDDVPTIWVLLDPKEMPEERVFKMYGTGHPVALTKYKYIGTVQTGGFFMWHLFEDLSKEQG